jgi:hypothetical protein
MQAQASTESAASSVIEGGKLVVELIKVFGSKKDQEHNGNCKNSFADLCVENQSAGSITVSLLHRSTGETREVVVLPQGRECCLQAKEGIWTYDLKVSGSILSIRKGDLKLEGCNNIVMSIK